jgi:betaine-aldehyde dehydrogenase
MSTTATSVAMHWIDGEWVDSEEHRDSVNPATGETIGSYAMGTPEEAQRAIDAAKRAFHETSWRTDRALRSRVLYRMAERFEERAHELVEILGLENGKVHDQGALEVAFAPETCRFNAALALTDVGTTSVVSEGELSIVVRQPVGVAGIIAPWNSPVALGIRSLAPALAAGCTAVMNLPRQTAQTNALIADVVGGTEELPPGVANVITGGHVSGDLLVRSPDVPTISFTGSTKTGKQISAAASENLKRVGLERGGKTPLILFPDADLEQAMPVIVAALIVFSGQFCMTGSRLLVHEAIADQVREQLARRLEAVKVGPAADPDSEMGPIIDKANVVRIDKLVEDAIAKGAKVLVRGGPITEGPLAAGAFYRPTLLEVSDNSMSIVQDEVFGPVLTMQTFDGDAEAVALANSTRYGLAATMFTGDQDRAARVSAQLVAGTVWVNCFFVRDLRAPFGGAGLSGIGREGGTWSFDFYSDVKNTVYAPEGWQA